MELLQKCMVHFSLTKMKKAENSLINSVEIKQRQFWKIFSPNLFIQNNCSNFIINVISAFSMSMCMSAIFLSYMI